LISRSIGGGKHIDGPLNGALEVLIAVAHERQMDVNEPPGIFAVFTGRFRHRFAYFQLLANTWPS
jgi:hypothetical protein